MEFLSFLFYSVYFDNETPVTEAPVKVSKAPDLPEADVCCGHGMYTSDAFMNLYFFSKLYVFNNLAFFVSILEQLITTKKGPAAQMVMSKNI